MTEQFVIKLARSYEEIIQAVVGLGSAVHQSLSSTCALETKEMWSSFRQGFFTRDKLVQK